MKSTFILGLTAFSLISVTLLSAGIEAENTSRCEHNGKVIIVENTAPGSIQAAVNQATPHTTIIVPPGTYKGVPNPYNAVVFIPVNLTGLKLIGEPGAIIDCEENFDHGILSIRLNSDGSMPPFPDTGAPCPGSGIKHLTIKGLEVRNYEENGIVLFGATDFAICDCQTISSGPEDGAEYGIFPQCSNRGTISGCTAIGHSDAAIYVGISDHISVRNCKASNSVIGIELSTSKNCDAQFNEVFNNNVGIFCVLEPNHDLKVNKNHVVACNDIHDNNQTTSLEDLPLPPSGILVVGSGPIVLSNNQVYQHDFFGVLVADLPLFVYEADPILLSQRFPCGVTVVKNTMFSNGSLLGEFEVSVADFTFATNAELKCRLCIDDSNVLRSGVGAQVSPSDPITSFPVAPFVKIPLRTKKCSIPDWAQKVLKKCKKNTKD